MTSEYQNISDIAEKSETHGILFKFGKKKCLFISKNSRQVSVFLPFFRKQEIFTAEFL